LPERTLWKATASGDGGFCYLWAKLILKTTATALYAQFRVSSYDDLNFNRGVFALIQMMIKTGKGVRIAYYALSKLFPKNTKAIFS